MHRYLIPCCLLCAASPLVAADKNRAEYSVILTETAVKNLNLITVEAEETDFEETVFALGRVDVAPGKGAIVSTRIAGRVSAVLVEIDQSVQKGEEVARIESRQPGDPPPTISLQAPLSGLISKMEIKLGEPVGPETTLMEIVDLSEVHALAKVPEHLAEKIKIGQKAHVRFPGYPNDVFESKLAHLGALADGDSNTIEAVFHLNNPDLKLRPEMRAEFSIVTSKREGVMSVPRDAVQGDGTERFVYVADYELKNTFVKTPVVVGAQNDRLMEITSGLFPGDQVVTRGAYALVFAGKGNSSLKEALDAAHGHPHADDGSELTEEQAKVGNKDGASHSHQSGFTPWTIFFASTSGLLLILLALLSNSVRKSKAA